MPSNKFIKQSKISKGQYTVTINLRGIPNSEKFRNLEKILKEIANDCDDDIGDIYIYDGNKLTYTSEALLPPERYVKKPKVLIVFGNPAIHSIKNGNRDGHENMHYFLINVEKKSGKNDLFEGF